MRIRWTPPAAADLERIGDFLEQTRPYLRDSTVRRIYRAIRSLRLAPDRGRRSLHEDTREIFFRPLPYVAIYAVKDDSIEILRIIHTSRERR